jgi:hypothetical protein
MARTEIQFRDGSGSVSYEEDRDNSGLSVVLSHVLDWLGKSSKWRWGIIFAVAFTLLGIFLIDPTPPLRRVVDALPYVWPKGCPKLPIQVYPPEALNPGYSGAVSRLQIWPSNRIIPCACADQTYRIIDFRKKYGLMKVGRGPAKFYRVGSDAVQISASKKVGMCYKDHAYENFFQKLR